jgi:uncharacterized protein (DUF2345 family)
VDRDWLERTNADLREGVMGSTQQQQSLRNQVRPRVGLRGPAGAALAPPASPRCTHADGVFARYCAWRTKRWRLAL